MTTKKIKILSIAVLSALTLSTTIAYADENTENVSYNHQEKDYTQAPYYYALEEWFDFYNYSDEERIVFMQDTETLEYILYNDEYWNYGNYEFVSSEEMSGISTYASFTFPLSEYPVGTYFSKYSSTEKRCPPCTHHSSGCQFNGSCGCQSFDSAIQCLGFALKIYWMTHGTKCSAQNQIDGLSGASYNADGIKNYIKNKTIVGSHIRFHVKGQTYDHSIIIGKITESGIEAYDANSDHQCGIDYRFMSWSTMCNNYDFIRYSNV